MCVPPAAAAVLPLGGTAFDPLTIIACILTLMTSSGFMNKDDVTAENKAAVRRLLDDDDDEEEEEGKEEGSSPRPSRGGVLGDAIQSLVCKDDEQVR